MIKNDFSKGPQGWCSYEYHASIVTGQNVFILTTWEAEGRNPDSPGGLPGALAEASSLGFSTSPWSGPTGTAVGGVPEGPAFGRASN